MFLGSRAVYLLLLMLFHIKMPTMSRLPRVIRAFPVRDLHLRSLFSSQNQKPRQRRSTVHYLGAPKGISRDAVPRRHYQYLVLYRVHLLLPPLQIWSKSRSLRLRLRRVRMVTECRARKSSTQVQHRRHPYTAHQVRTSSRLHRLYRHLPASLQVRHPHAHLVHLLPTPFRCPILATYPRLRHLHALHIPSHCRRAWRMGRLRASYSLHLHPRVRHK